jgi:hypothetical protein
MTKQTIAPTINVDPKAQAALVDTGKQATIASLSAIYAKYKVPIILIGLPIAIGIVAGLIINPIITYKLSKEK